MTQAHKLYGESKRMFKVGDEVRKKNGSLFGIYKYIETIVEPRMNITVCKDAVWVSNGWISASELELVPKVKYEDSWTLNDGRVTVPDDAKVLKDDTGDVVAFKKVKKPVGKEYVRYAGKDKPFDRYNTTGVKDKMYKHKIIFKEVDGELVEVRLEK
jgi:hypothetical protein